MSEKKFEWDIKPQTNKHTLSNENVVIKQVVFHLIPLENYDEINHRRSYCVHNMF